ncbi:hypothetical protein DY000_02060516 [Brassica cretica]|uniref:Uncharacterized protein n=1 Tax=Brassica cretica TaxID=69181 RepID=A0ABQ7AWJ2_BRACR|nr:hypothetical protein DY000_02060516 [Brassica cretica]
MFVYIMAKGNEKYGSGEPSRVEEADISDTASASIIITTSMSTNGTTSTSIDGTTSASSNGTTTTSIDGTTTTSIDGTTSTSIDGTTSTSIDALIDRNTCCQLTPIEIPKGSSCPQDIADSTPESTNISSSCRAQDIDREITMEDFSELKDFLKYTSERDLETSPKASIDRHRQPDIDRPRLPDIDRHPSDDIDRHPLFHELPGYTIEEEQVEDRMQESEASHLVVHEHLRPHIFEIPIPPDRSVHLGSYNGVFADTMYAVASQRGTTTRSDKSGRKKRKNWKKRKRIKGDPQLSLILHFSNGVRKYRVRSRCVSQPFAKLRPLIIAEMIDKGEETVEAFTKK